jgi:hypothetical protein
MSTWDERMTPRPKPPKMVLVRTLWTMTRLPKQADHGSDLRARERRVHVDNDPNNLVDSLLSREGDLPLTFWADELKAILLGQGWVE